MRCTIGSKPFRSDPSHMSAWRRQHDAARASQAGEQVREVDPRESGVEPIRILG